MSKPRPFLWKRLLLCAFFTLVALITLATLAGTWISFQGRREWAKTKADLLARGEKLSLVELAPPLIPDALNFFADPMWREVMDVVVTTDDNYGIVTESKVPHEKQKLEQALWQKISGELIDQAKGLPGLNLHLGERLREAIDSENLAIRKASDEADRKLLARLILDTIQPISPILSEIENLLRRPEARSETDYSLGPMAPWPHVRPLWDIGRALNARTIANLYLGHSDSSKADILSMLRLADTIKTEPFGFSLLVRTSISDMANINIAAGIRDHAWTDAQLAEFGSSLGNIDLLPQLALAFRGERGSLNQFVELGQRSPARAYEIVRASWRQSASSKIFPSFWEHGIFDRPCYEIGSRLFNSTDQSHLNRAAQSWVDAIDRAPERGIAPGDFASQNAEDDWKKRFHPFFALFSFGPSFAIRTCHVQDRIFQTRIACALEQYWLRHGAYPNSLDSLVPEFLPKVPQAVLAGQQIRYRREGADAFQLWTAGWNQIDENGSLAAAREGMRFFKGDWAWWVPLPPLPPRR